MAASLERELKVEVDDSFHVPDLSAVIGVSVVSLPEVTLEATYYDTASYQLARFGATLRHRTSSAGSQTWTLKLPAADAPGAERRGAGALDRDEIDFDGPADKLPADALALLRTYLRDETPVPVAVLDTRRRRNLLMSATDTLAEMDDDSVEYRTPDGRTGSFRELEIELSASGPVAILRQVHDVLVAAGVPDAAAQPKLFRAIGGAPPPVVAPGPAELGHSLSARELVPALVGRATSALLRDDPRVRLGDDPAAVARWGAELARLAVALDDMQRAIEPAWHETVREVVDDLRGAVEAVAGLDAVLGRLSAGASRLLPEDQGAAAELTDILASQRKALHDPLGDHLDSPAYLELVDLLVAAAASPPLRRGRSRPAAPMMERALRARLDHLERCATDALATGFHPTLRARTEGEATDVLPLVRAASEARGTAELAGEIWGRPARKVLRALTELDGWVEELAAATSAQRWLRDTAPGLDGRLALAAGQLLAGETRGANRARRHWVAAWRDVEARARKWPTTR